MGANEGRFFGGSLEGVVSKDTVEEVDVSLEEFKLTQIDQDIAALEKQIGDTESFDTDQLVLEDEDDLKRTLRVASEAENAKRVEVLAQLKRERSALIESLEAIEKARKSSEEAVGLSQ